MDDQYGLEPPVQPPRKPRALFGKQKLLAGAGTTMTTLEDSVNGNYRPRESLTIDEEIFDAPPGATGPEESVPTHRATTVRFRDKMPDIRESGDRDQAYHNRQSGAVFFADSSMERTSATGEGLPLENGPVSSHSSLRGSSLSQEDDNVFRFGSYHGPGESDPSGVTASVPESGNQEATDWDAFSEAQMRNDCGDCGDRCLSITQQLFKILTCLVLFGMVYFGGLFSLGTVVFASGNVRISSTEPSPGDTTPLGISHSVLECVNYTNLPPSPPEVVATTLGLDTDTDYADVTSIGLPLDVTSPGPETTATTEVVPIHYTRCLVLPRGWNTTRTHTDTCLAGSDDGTYGVTYHTQMCDTVAMQWVWCLCLIMVTADALVFLRCLWIVLFKTKAWPSKSSSYVWLVVLGTDTLYVTGLCMLVFVTLPLLDNVLMMAMVMMGVGMIPSIMTTIQRATTVNRGSEWTDKCYLVLDILAVVGQFIGLVLWPISEAGGEYPNLCWSLPLSLLLISCGYWENYIDLALVQENQSSGRVDKLIIFLASVRNDIRKDFATKVRMISSLWRAVWTFCMTMAFIMVHPGMGDISMLFDLNHQKHCEPNHVSPVLLDGADLDWVWVWLTNVACGMVCYFGARTAAKIQTQRFSYALALTLVTPSIVGLLIYGCGLWNEDPCHFTPDVPAYVFFRCYAHDWNGYNLWLLMIAWCLSQFWITFHVWIPPSDSLAKSDRLFEQPLFDGLLLQQSLLYNRNRNQKIEDCRLETDVGNAEAPMREEVKQQQTDAEVPMIYICATMWHETMTEMTMMMTSIFNLDKHQAGRRLAMEHTEKKDHDFFTFEAHIFFDDAMEYLNRVDFRANEYVKLLVSVMDQAASAVHNAPVTIGPPIKYSTPYGGRLEWTMLGGNKVTAHLKDKQKARHKKRWSQVMYMYYILGFDVHDQTKAENKYLLALDGDVDFKPEALARLVARMKRDEQVGAACGRIHPVGSGAMVWYQKFEYALGHWLQKASEHVFGCVLCSPGCFSLFRATALEAVLKTYTTVATQARHFVQYDQGEDRWLCTLLLQAGWRVEYCAASDALTFAPEGFYEFYRQRRRWGPSSMANIIDLLGSWKHTTRENDSISLLYIIYQTAIFGSALFGTGTIFLMIVGSLELALGLNIWVCVLLNLIPVLIFVILCFAAKDETQLWFALILTAAYALLQMIVLVGIILTMVDEGWCSPTSLFFFYVAGTYLLAALLHPQEFLCIIHGFIYFLAIPSMYMLLMIYSITNLHVVSWGTRETPKTKEEVAAEEDRANAAPEDADKQAEPAKKADDGLMAQLAKTTEGFKMSCGQLCTWIWCPEERPIESDPYVRKAFHTLDKQGEQLSRMETLLVEVHAGQEDEEFEVTVNPELPPSLPAGNNENDPPNNWIMKRKSTKRVKVVPPEAAPDDGQASRDPPKWTDDPNLGTGPTHVLEENETQQFEEFIEKYLKPLEKDKDKEQKVENELLALRNKVSAAFLLANAMLVVTLLVLQVNELSVPWPCGDDLVIEPIGFMFLIFYVFIMLLQTVGMLIHRMGTYLHVMNDTKMNCCSTVTSENDVTDADIEDVLNTISQAPTPGSSSAADDVNGTTTQRRRYTTKRQQYASMKAAHDAGLEKNKAWVEQHGDVTDPKELEDIRLEHLKATTTGKSIRRLREQSRRDVNRFVDPQARAAQTNHVVITDGEAEDAL